MRGSALQAPKKDAQTTAARAEKIAGPQAGNDPFIKPYGPSQP